MVRRILFLMGMLGCAFGAASCASGSALATALGLSAASAAVTNTVANLPPPAPPAPVMPTATANQVVDTPTATVINQNGQTIIVMKKQQSQY